MFVAALLIIPKKWKQAKYPSTHEWINKRWYCRTMGYYSVFKKKKKNGVLIHATIWMSLENIMLNKTRQTTYCMIPFTLKIGQ